MRDDTDTRAQRRSTATPTPEGAAITPRDTATGQVRPTDGPMERAGTEAEARARGEAGSFEGIASGDASAEARRG